ncbi:MAG: SGNH/GDSL hydrolase family protein [bacterium]
MHPLRQQPILESLILVAGMISIMLLIQGTNTWIALSTTKQNPPIAKSEDGDMTSLRNVVGNNPNCPFNPPDRLGQTEGGVFTQAEVTTDGFNKIGEIFKSATAVIDAKIDVKNKGDSGAQPRLNTITGKDTGIKFYKVTSMHAPDLSEGKPAGQIAEIPAAKGDQVRVPFSGWRILNGTKIFGMVMSIEADGIRIANSRNDRPIDGGGGYDLYITGITVDPEIRRRYDKANKEFGRTCMPEVSIEEVIGTANGNIKVALRDKGALLPLNSGLFWSSEASTVMTIEGDKKTPSAVQPAQNQPQPAAPGAPAAPADPAAPGTPATITPGPVVQLNTVQDSIIMIDRAIANVKKIVSGGATQTRTRILLLGDSNTANENFGRVEMTWKSNQSNKIEYKKIAKGEWSTGNLMNQLRLEKDIDNNSVNYTDFKYALILIGLKDSDNFSVELFKTNLKAIVDKLLEYKVIPILQTINDFRTETGRKETAEAINAAIIAVADEKKIPYVDTSEYIKVGHMTKDGFHYNTRNYGPNYCKGSVKEGDCNPPKDDADSLTSPISGHGIRNAILREAIKMIEKNLESVNQSIVVTANTSRTGLKPLTLFGVQAQTAPESIISILQSYGSSGYLCYDFGGLSCVPATLSTIEGRAVRVDVMVDKSYPAKPICVSRTNSCNGGVFLDPNL